jgi:hypothetical protein
MLAYVAEVRKVTREPTPRAVQGLAGGAPREADRAARRGMDWQCVDVRKRLAHVSSDTYIG